MSESTKRRPYKKREAPEPTRMYMEVDLSHAELPTGRWGYTARELAEKCGTTRENIYSQISHAKKRGSRCRYVVVQL